MDSALGSDGHAGDLEFEAGWEQRLISMLVTIFATEDDGEAIARLLRVLNGEDDARLSDDERDVLREYRRLFPGRANGENTA